MSLVPLLLSHFTCHEADPDGRHLDLAVALTRVDKKKEDDKDHGDVYSHEAKDSKGLESPVPV